MPTSTPPNEVRESIEIAATPAEAYAAVSDVTRMPQWSPETVKITVKGDGTRWRGWNRIGFHRWYTTGRVVADVPARTFAFDVDLHGIAVARWAYDFEPTATGCRVTETWTDHRHGVLGGVVKKVGKLATGTPHTEVDTPVNLATTLTRLRDHLESSKAAPAGA